jgi:hypothetical protein
VIGVNNALSEKTRGWPKTPSINKHNPYKTASSASAGGRGGGREECCRHKEREFSGDTHTHTHLHTSKQTSKTSLLFSPLKKKPITIARDYFETLS